MVPFKKLAIVYICVVLVCFLTWLILFCPIQLGGNTGYFVVHTRSMIPTLFPGDLVITKPSPVYNVGDIVAYVAPNGYIIVHRIVARVNSSCYITKGDNNPIPDPWIVCKGRIFGRMVLRIPLLGSVLDMLKSNPILLILTTAAAGIVVASPLIALYVYEIRRGDRSQKFEFKITKVRVSERTLLILVVVASLLTLAMLGTMYTYFSSFKDYTVKTFKVGIWRLSINVENMVKLYNNSLYGNTTVYNVDYTYIPIVKSIVLIPITHLQILNKNISNIKFLRIFYCIVSVDIKQKVRYGWTKHLMDIFTRNCNNTKIVLNIRKIIDMIYKISSQTQSYSNIYTIHVVFNVPVEYGNTHHVYVENIVKSCDLTINFGFHIIKLGKCSITYTYYRNVVKRSLNVINTFMGSIPIYFLKLISLMLIPLPIASLSISLASYYVGRRKARSRKYTLREIFDLYSDYIVEGGVFKANIPLNAEIVSVDNFEDLVKISKTYNVPIMHSIEKISPRTMLHIFYTIVGSKVHVYEIIEKT